MDAQDTPVAFDQHLEVAARSRRLDNTESVFLTRYLDIGRIVASDLQEHAGVRAALVGLPGGMQEPRSEAEAGGDALAVADQDADILERFAVACVAFDVGEEPAIVAFSDSLEMCRKTFHQRGGALDGVAVLFVGKEREAMVVEERRLRRQSPGQLIRSREFACLVLAGFDIRLIERIDAED
jgi:hypothetical protein